MASDVGGHSTTQGTGDTGAHDDYQSVAERTKSRVAQRDFEEQFEEVLVIDQGLRVISPPGFCIPQQGMTKKSAIAYYGCNFLPDLYI
jgi:hypothetical protein